LQAAATTSNATTDTTRSHERRVLAIARLYARRCRKPPGPSGRLIDPIRLSLAAIKRPKVVATDCDGRAFAAAMGDRVVIVTGRSPALPAIPPPPPEAISVTEGMIIRPIRGLMVESICHARDTGQPAPSVE
jgi:hypothetical protein